MLGLFNSPEKEEQSTKPSWEVYVDKYLESIERINKVGGFPLIVMFIGVVFMGITAYLSMSSESFAGAS